MDKIKVSIIIAVGRENISETISSLKAQDSPGSYEIILVCEEGKSFKDDIAKIIFSKDKNPAHKRNLGVKESLGGIVAFIDDDAIASKDWLKKGVEILEKNPEFAGAGGPNLIPENAKKGEKITEAILNTPFIGSGHVGYSSKAVKRKAKIGEIHLVNFFVRKNIFSQIGGFNENIGYGCEDSEFIYLAGKKLKKIFLYDSNLYVFHHRRKFGLDYLKQRFKLRINNGRLIFAYPGLYLKNINFLFAIFSLPVVIFLLFCCRYLFGTFIIYCGVLIIFNLIYHPRLFPFLVFGYILHHLTYIAGIWSGIFSGLVKIKKTRKIKR